jgi:hypothetical protein
MNPDRCLNRRRSLIERPPFFLKTAVFDNHKGGEKENLNGFGFILGFKHPGQGGLIRGYAV